MSENYPTEWRKRYRSGLEHIPRYRLITVNGEKRLQVSVEYERITGESDWGYLITETKIEWEDVPEGVDSHE